MYGRQAVNLATHCGDFILRRSDGVFAYQLAVVVDDALSGVTEVVRGRDLLLSAAQQLYLYRLLGFEPPKYCHHPLLVNEQGQRLCKRDKSLALSAMRQTHSAQEIIGLLSHSIGLTPTSDPSLPSSWCHCSNGQIYRKTTSQCTQLNADRRYFYFLVKKMPHKFANLLFFS